MNVAGDFVLMLFIGDTTEINTSASYMHLLSSIVVKGYWNETVSQNNRIKAGPVSMLGRVR